VCPPGQYRRSRSRFFKTAAGGRAYCRGMNDTTKVTATGTAESKNWEQTPYAAAMHAPELAAASGVDVYHGDVEGEGHWQGLTIAGPDGNGDLLSLQRMICVVGGRSGTFVLRISGTFDSTGSRATWEVVPGSGTGELRGISGTGGFQSSGETTTYTLDYTLDHQLG
jgi:hypothetical protein